MDNNNYSYGYNTKENKTYTPEPEQGTQYSANTYGNENRMPGWAKALIVIACIVVFCVLLMVGCSTAVKNFTSGFGQGLGQFGSIIYGSTDDTFAYVNSDYIGTIYIDGTIDESGAGTYNHKYILESIDYMIDDDENKGLIIWMNTNGGTVFASDEVYLKLCEYREKTGRPIFTSMQSMAASGGYYIGCVGDKIFANRNCWTGSIGVTLGSYLDISELLDKYGIKVNTITAGDNKAMGSSLEPMTKGQIAILQSLADEAYEQFVGIIADERDMDIKNVKKLADGRIYSAYQALENGLIDEIGTYEDAVCAMRKQLGYDEDGHKIGGDEDADDYFLDLVECRESTITNPFLSLFGKSGVKSDAAYGNLASVLTASQIEELLELNGKVKLSYISNISK